MFIPIIPWANYITRNELPSIYCNFKNDKEELNPRYFLCEDGEKIWNEKKKDYQATRDYKEAKKMLQEQRIRYIKYLVTNEKISRCQKIKMI